MESHDRQGLETADYGLIIMVDSVLKTWGGSQSKMGILNFKPRIRQQQTIPLFIHRNHRSSPIMKKRNLSRDMIAYIPIEHCI